MESDVINYIRILSAELFVCKFADKLTSQMLI